MKSVFENIFSQLYNITNVELISFSFLMLILWLELKSHIVLKVCMNNELHTKVLQT
jgi:hypothetical protein